MNNEKPEASLSVPLSVRPISDSGLPLARRSGIIFLGSTRDGYNATYPRGKVYGIYGICPCIIGCAIHTGG